MQELLHFGNLSLKAGRLLTFTAMRRLLFSLLLVGSIAPCYTHAQAPNYPQHYFRNPLNLPILLAGNFGECRPGHFHSGMDIKTAGIENQPVFAAADGYISRMKQEPGGFGHSLYITHPNGYTTLYAHLNNYVPRLQQYLRTQQYSQKSWTVDLTFPPDKFPVKKGEQIAWSGNTGGSTAPHLHFEIRDTKTEHPLNPQLFGFDVKDTKAPVVTAVALYDMVMNNFYPARPTVYTLHPNNTGFVPGNDTVAVTAFGTGTAIGLGLRVNDYMNGSDNTLAFYTAEWYMDEALQGRIRLNDIGYDETRYLNGYGDYFTKQKGGGDWIECLFQLPGNHLDGIYEGLKQYGVLTINDRKAHAVRIVITDDAGNVSTVHFQLLVTGSSKAAIMDCITAIYPNKNNDITANDFRLNTDNLSLYACACYNILRKPNANGYSSVFSTGLDDVPSHTYFNVGIRADKPVPFTLRSKIALRFTDGKDTDGTAAKLEDGWYNARTRTFGSYWLVADTVAPVITPVAAKGTRDRLLFKVSDALTSVKSCEALLDGAWVLLEQHEHNWFYVFDGHCPAGKHVLTVTATDENGNRRALSYPFVR